MYSARACRAILTTLIAGETDPVKLADLAQGAAREKRGELVQALHGRIRAHHRGLLKAHLDLVGALQQALADIDAALGKKTWRRSSTALAC
jgi:transposase